MKKFLLVLPSPESSYYQPLTRAIEYLGWDYRVFCYREFDFKEKVLAIGGKRDYAYQLVNSRLRKVIMDYQPKIMFVAKGENVLPETVMAMKKVGGVSVNWFVDDFRLYGLSRELSKYYDVSLHFDSFFVSILRADTLRDNIYHFPFAADILPNDPAPDIMQKIYNISMVGTVYPVREELLPAVASLGLNIWGDNSWKDTNLAKYWQGPAQFKDLMAIYSKSKIGINVEYSPMGWSILTRVYEIITSGTFCLTRERKELSAIFKLNKEVVAFKTQEELKDKVKYYLCHETAREQIAKRGYARAKACHTYTHRFTELFNQLGIY